MQHIPDKQFDKLFKDKFAEAEVEPSADLWANIEQQLAPKKKRIIPIYWMVAASVVIAITVMLVFSKKDVIRLQGQPELSKTVGRDIVVGQNVAINNQTTLAKMDDVDTGKSNRSFAVVKEKDNHSSDQKINNNAENNVLAMQPIQTIERLPIKQQEVKPLDIATIKEPVEEIIYTAKVDVPQSFEDNMINENNQTRKGIRNVGDLVNFVVEKVDKRDKKLIRFNTDDDDNSSLIGINIGFLKFNKKNK